VEQTSGVHIDPTNADQARAWDGPEGAYWAVHARRFDEAVAAYHRPFLDAAEIDPGQRILDIGCGTGQTTRDAARRAAQGWAVGVDLSLQMIQLARALAAAEGLANVWFEQADAQIYPFQAEAFDVAISRAGAMFFGDAVAALRNIARALCPRARLTLLTWQSLARNEWIREFRSALSAGRQLPIPPPDAPGPFALSQPDRVRSLLTTAGFTDVRLEERAAHTSFGPTAAEALEFVLGLTGWMLEGLDHAGRARALEPLQATIAAHDTATGIRYESAAWIITARKAG